MTWHDWEDLGGPISAAPAVSSWAPGRLDCFVRGVDGNVYHKWFSKGWHGWEKLGGPIVGAPTAVSWGPNRIDLFARGQNDRMMHKWWRLVPTVRLHVKILTNPTTFTIDQMVAGMRQVYHSRGIAVQVASTENLNLPLLNDLDVGACAGPGSVTAEQSQLFANRNSVGALDVAVYFVRATVPAYNGCAAHPTGLPSVAVASTASRWTLGHEVGHVLDLKHVNDNDRLMTQNGTGNITNPPPDITTAEGNTMNASPYTVDI